MTWIARCFRHSYCVLAFEAETGRRVAVRWIPRGTDVALLKAGEALCVRQQGLFE